METKHTPGPWVVQQYHNHIGYSIWGGGRGCIAERWYDTKQEPPYGDEIEANARLIAAAPEMLDAMDPDSLEAIAEELFGTFQNSARADSLRVIARKQRQAISKATGETYGP